jgi:hypothetical protein
MAHFARRMRSLRIRGDVLPIHIPAYTERVHTRGKAEQVDNGRIYNSFLTSLRTLTTAQY